MAILPGRGGLSSPAIGSLLALLCVALLRIFDILFGGNFHVVCPEQCYRGGQPSADNLSQIVRDLDIRTVINMRGVQDKTWFHRENEVARALGFKLVHIGMWSNSPPEVNEFRNLVRTLADEPGPFFLHCHTGSDRTGLGSALFLLLRTDATLEEARGQLGLFFGHIPGGRASCHDELLVRYGSWLRERGFDHAPATLRRWAMEDYDGKTAP